MRERVLSIRINARRTVSPMQIGKSLFIIILSIKNGQIIADAPTTVSKLKMFEPKTFAMERS